MSKKKFNVGRRVYFVDMTAQPYPVLREGSIRDVHEADSTFCYNIAVNRSVNKRIVDEGGTMYHIPECNISFTKAEVYEKIVESLKKKIGDFFNELLRVSTLLAKEK